MYKGGTYSHVPAYSMGGKPKADPNSRVPGPGSYDALGGFGSGLEPKYSMGKSSKINRDLGVPGPGTYDSNNGLKPKNTSLGRDDRFGKYGNGMPGPGSYDKNYGGKGGFSFGKMKRTTPVKPAGPDYNIPHSIPDVASYNYPSVNTRKIHI